MKFSALTLIPPAILLSLSLAASGASAGVDEAPDVLAGTTQNARGPQPVADRPRKEFNPIGIRYGSIIFYPTILATMTYDDNLFATPYNQTAIPRIARARDFVFLATPMVRAEMDLGTTRLGAYVKTETRAYTTYSALNSIAPSVGIGGKTEITRDLIVQGRADYGYKLEEPTDTRIATPKSLGSYVRYHDFTTSGSINKTFGRAFLSIGGGFQHLAYQDARDVTGGLVPQKFRDANLFNVTARAGYEVGPGLRAFFEPSLNWHQYINQPTNNIPNQPNSNSRGYKLVSGVSMSLFRLLSGEVYGGYMEQTYRSQVGTVSGFTYGGKLIWYPTNMLTISANGERVIKDVGLVNAAHPQGTPVIVSSVGVRADYELLRNFILGASVSVADNKYVNDTRRVRNYDVGASATYRLNRAFTASLDYRNSLSIANTAGENSTRNKVSLSIKAQY